MPRRKKSSKGQDYISNLPDFVIGHILSFLSTKDAVRTSALSKRWIYTWTFVTKLYFCDGENYYHHSYKRIKQFSNFVSRVLFHINSASIQNFDLSMGEEYDADYINQWLSAVLKRGVKNICVVSYNNYNFSFYPLFQSPSLETLVLRMMVGCIIKVSTFVCLPSLTRLHLSGITFTRYSSDKLNELTLKLPLLRNYSTSNCTWLGVKSVTFETPLLEEVNMAYSISGRKSRTEIKFKFVYQGYISSLSETILVDGYIRDHGFLFASSSVFLLIQNV